MKLVSLLFAAVLVSAMSETALAFDQCETTLSNPDVLSRQLSDSAIAQAPVKYHDVAVSIKVLTRSPSEAVIPFAAEQQGAKVIVFPPLFANVVCKVAIATYLDLDDIQKDSFDQAAAGAAKCFDDGGSQKTCLVAFANELADRYRKAFLEQSEESRRVALIMYQDALSQVVMHEYAHHLLSHFARIQKQQLSRIDAEFEADLFAITNGLQNGQPASAMFYFFNGLAEIEGYTKRLATKDYESSVCRAKNVADITKFIGAAPVSLLDAAAGGRQTLTRNSPAMMRSLAKQQFGGAPPSLGEGSCGLVAKVALGDSYAELKRLYLRVEEDAEFLFGGYNKMDAARANRLLHDLSEMSKEFRYMDGLDAKAMALMLRNWDLKGRELAGVVSQVDRLLGDQAATGNFQSEDFANLLLVQGTATLQERTDLPAQVRLDQSFSLLQRSVFYEPALAQAWVNLAFIAFKRGDCDTAMGYAETSVAKLAPTVSKEGREGAISFAKQMKEWSVHPETCKAKAAAFHPYPGL